MLWNLSVSENAEIVLAVANAVHSAFSDPSKSEPQLVANLVKCLPDELNKLVLGKVRSIQVGGVFIHAKPFAACSDFPEPSPKSVELGDLLLIRTAISRGVVVDRRALLLQAKKAAKLPTKPDNPNQHHLYENWPSFEYVRSGSVLNGKKRHVQGPGLYSGAKYFLIGPHPTSLDCIYCWPFVHGPILACQLATAEPTQSVLSAYKCFFQEIINFIAGNAGREYLSPPPKRKRGWDKVIDDLLKAAVSKKKSVFTKRAKVSGGLRGNALFFMAGNIDLQTGKFSALGSIKGENSENNQEPPIISNDIVQDDDDGGGVSVIEFVVTDNEWRETQQQTENRKK